jgi:shikimate dehydrogenase
MSDRYAVIGNPVEHSKSPQIHAEFARQTGQDMVYERLLAPLDAFEATAKQFFSGGGKGLNVTVPFKNEAFKAVTPSDTSFGGVLDAEAVNTIQLVNGRLIGHNTDGIGLVKDLEQNLGFLIAGKRVLLMGAGGATRGVMHPILEKHPELLVVANRTLDKAISVVRHFQKFKDFTSGGISASPYDALGGAQFDLVINATSAGLRGEMHTIVSRKCKKRRITAINHVVGQRAGCENALWQLRHLAAEAGGGGVDDQIELCPAQSIVRRSRNPS